jgi:nucleoside-diphosphate-sugar epimerase
VNSSSRVIITGSSGFIGSALKKYFKDHKVSCLGISRKAAEGTDIVVRNYHEVIGYNDGNTLLINLAGNNTLISNNEINFISALSESYKEKMIFMSSSRVYGYDSKGSMSENKKLSNLNDYSKSKISLEKKILKNKGMILRLSNVYGKGMSEHNIFNVLHDQIIENKKEIILKNMKSIRDFIYIDDFCECLLRVVSSKVRNLILNIGTGKGTDVLTLVKYMCKSLGHNYTDKNIISNELTESRLVLDIGLSKKIYNWAPKTNIEKGIQKWLK